MYPMLMFINVLFPTYVYYLRECNERTVLMDLKRPTYEFSLNTLDELAREYSDHFVYSPINTLSNLLTLANGAQDETLKEILNLLNVKEYEQNPCFRKHVPGIINALDKGLNASMIRRSIIAIHNLMELKDSYKSNIEEFEATKVISLSFRNKMKAAASINKIIEKETNGVVTGGTVAQDLEIPSLFTNDIAYMKADWRRPFDPVYTKSEPFYSDEEEFKGKVNMMNQIDFFNLIDIPKIEAQVLELPFNGRSSMIILLPKGGRKAIDMFRLLHLTSLSEIFSLLRSTDLKLVNVTMPRFKITTNIDNMPKYLYQMGVKRIFIPHVANFRRMSDYDVFVSKMKNTIDIEVTETSVLAKIIPSSLVKLENVIDFTLNRPFAYLIVDKSTEIILFAGVYSNPSLY